MFRIIKLAIYVLIIYPVSVNAKHDNFSHTKNVEPSISNTVKSPINDLNYKVNLNGTVTDTRTGLTWKKCSEGQTGANCDGEATIYSWEHAIQQANNVNSKGGFAGFKDWRVPGSDYEN